VAVLRSRISGPHRLAKYIGTRGSTQGDRKEASPAPKATKKDIFSILRFVMIVLLDQKYSIIYSAAVTKESEVTGSDETFKL